MKPEVNLLPKYERYSNLSNILFIIFLVLFLILASLLTYFFFKERSLLAEQETEITRLSQEKDILEARLSAVSGTVDATTISDAVAFAETLAVPASKLVAEHMDFLPERGYLVNYVYDYQTVTMEAHFETIPDAAHYMNSLVLSPYSLNERVDEIQTAEESPVDRPAEEEEENEEERIRYDVLPRYQATYSIEVNHEELMGEEDEDE